MRQERESKYDSDKRDVIDLKVRQILPDPRGGFGEVFRPGKGGAVEEFRQGAALSEALTDGGGEPRKKRAESRCGDWGLGLGLRVCDRNRRWGSHLRRRRLVAAEEVCGGA